MNPLRVVCAPDSFKGSLSAAEAAAAFALGVRRAAPHAEVVEHPVADGGEGTAAALRAALGGSWETLPAADPLGRVRDARYARLPSERAVVELAAASGLTLLTEAERDPLIASSLGTGQLLRHALEQELEVVVGVGGSATVDGGAGVLAGLGARLLDSSGQPLEPSGAALERVASVDLSGIPAAWKGKVRVACDVDSPLCGPAGAAAVFGPQKGASPAGVEQLERGLRRWSEVLAAACGAQPELANAPGTGAAGGVPYALAAALDASLVSGAELVLEVSGFAAALSGAQLCLTGEGRVDGQTSTGKAPWAVAQACRAAGVLPIAIGGSLGPGAGELARPDGFGAVFSAVQAPGPLADALAAAPRLLADAAEQVVRLVLAGR